LALQLREILFHASNLVGQVYERYDEQRQYVDQEYKKLEALKSGYNDEDKIITTMTTTINTNNNNNNNNNDDNDDNNNTTTHCSSQASQGLQ